MALRLRGDVKEGVRMLGRNQFADAKVRATLASDENVTVTLRKGVAGHYKAVPSLDLKGATGGAFELKWRLGDQDGH